MKLSPAQALRLAASMFGMTTPHYAAVDLGSNAFRMMIGQPARGSRVIREVAFFREPVRLSHGLRGSELDDSSLERGWRALERFGKRLRGFEPSRVRAVATNTVRVASNATVFLAKAEQRLGFQIDVISGQEEARLVYAGIAHTMPDANTTRLVVDIGGGSTELAIGRGEKLLAVDSVPIGSGTFGKRFFPDGVLDGRSLQLAERIAGEEIEKVATRYREHAWQLTIGSSGTARLLARLLQCNGLTARGRSTITYDGLLRLSLRLLEAGHLRRLELAGLKRHRMEALPGGLAVMLAVFKVFGIDEMLPSEPGLRFGVLHGLMQS
ncbi:Ppx/GppA family phosphatase [Cupriavidus sp. AcVe19-6a]|uniref:Ppx/GppA phosphatase family protein n=1 Tax=Cupriavidus sp. AcVe19-6a TaxID=2821358 RepID=UPI001AE7D7A1|nr:Ppx/GppA family phosphatase [Cupriavidus sp. AcVe19-6a]